MKKIFAIDQGQYLGGAEIFFSEMLIRLSAESEVHLVTGDNPKYIRLFQGSSVIIHSTTLPKLGLGSLFAFFRTRKILFSLVRELKPDLIISNTVRTHVLISSLAKVCNIPLLWMAHDLSFPSFLLIFFLRYPMKVISCSKFVQNWYQKRAFLNRKIQWQVQYPFTVDAKTLARLANIKKQKIIGMVGNFIPWKGHDLFIRAAAEISKKNPEYHGVLVGATYQNKSGSEQFLSKCQKLITELELGQVLTIKSQVANILDEMASWEILVHCSREPEPLGRVILEGMAARCAVVASKDGGPSEILQDGESGFLIQPTVEDLSKAVSKLIEDQALRDSFVKKGIGKLEMLGCGGG